MDVFASKARHTGACRRGGHKTRHTNEVCVMQAKAEDAAPRMGRRTSVVVAVADTEAVLVAVPDGVPVAVIVPDAVKEVVAVTDTDAVAVIVPDGVSVVVAVTDTEAEAVIVPDGVMLGVPVMVAVPDGDAPTLVLAVAVPVPLGAMLGDCRGHVREAKRSNGKCGRASRARGRVLRGWIICCQQRA